MCECPYNISETKFPKIFGRDAEFKKLMRRLEKITPDNVSIVGPKFIGKSIFLMEVAKHFIEKNDHFQGCIYWELRHNTPDSDYDFYIGFANELYPVLKKFDSEIAELLAEIKSDPYEHLKIVFESLDDQKQKLLIVLDGMDHLLLSSTITKNLWDNLRALAEYSSLKFVTGSRKPLSEICASPESRTSDFWRLFAESPLHLKGFRDEDWDDILSPFSVEQIGFQKGAISEIKNWSGGLPILVNLLCKKLWETISDNKEISQDFVNQFGSNIVKDEYELLSSIWEDLNEYEKADLSEMASNRGIAADKFLNKHLHLLEQKGLIKREKDSVFHASRVLEIYAKNFGDKSSYLKRYFSSQSDFEKSMKGVLQIRLENMPYYDRILYDYLNLAITNIEKPHVVLSQVRAISNRAFELIWTKDLQSGEIPGTWTQGWKGPDKEGNNPEYNPPEGKIPTKGGKQCYLLNLMTDHRKAGESSVSRSSFFLLDHLQSIGDFGQHLKNYEEPNIGFGYATCFSAIQLCEQLAHELQ